MLTITDEALELLATMLNGGGPHETLRLIVDEGGGCTVQPDNSRAGDVTFEHGGKTVLVVDQTTSDGLASRTLGITRVDGQPTFRLLLAMS